MKDRQLEDHLYRCGVQRAAQLDIDDTAAIDIMATMLVELASMLGARGKAAPTPASDGKRCYACGRMPDIRNRLDPVTQVCARCAGKIQRGQPCDY